MPVFLHHCCDRLGSVSGFWSSCFAAIGTGVILFWVAWLGVVRKGPSFFWVPPFISHR